MSAEGMVNLVRRAEDRYLNRGYGRLDLPFAVVTGYLGSGKTTLLHNILHKRGNLNITALVNDFATFNFDSHSVVSGGEASDVVPLSGGCVCCDLIGDLRDAVGAVVEATKAGRPVDYVLVETSGVSDPVSLIATLEQKFGSMYHVRLDSVIAVIDASDPSYSAVNSDGTPDVDALPSVAHNQISSANVVLVNKIDLIAADDDHSHADGHDDGSDGGDGDDVRSRIAVMVRALNPVAEVVWASYGKAGLAQLLDVQNEAELSTGSKIITHEHDVCYVKGSGQRFAATGRASFDAKAAAPTHSNGAAATDAYSSFVFESDTPIRLAGLQAALAAHLPPSVVRAKGLVWLADDKTRVVTFQISGRTRFEYRQGASWESRPSTRLVFILKDAADGEAEALLAALEAAVVPAAGDDEAVAVVPVAEAEADALAAMRNRMAEDARFEVLESTDNHRIRFRVVTALHAGVDSEMLNSTFVRSVNASVGTTLLAYTTTGAEDGSYVSETCPVVVAAPAAVLEATWLAIDRSATAVLSSFCDAHCNCGF